MLIEYRVRKDRVNLVIEKIRELVHFVMKNEPEILTYKAFQKPDEVSFVNFMTFTDEHSQKNLTKIFTRKIFKFNSAAL